MEESISERAVATEQKVGSKTETVHLEKLGISKPHMLVLFIISKGEQYLEDLIRKDQRKIERTLQDTIKKLNYEFGVLCPIH